MSSLNANPRDVATIDLGRVLDRLEKKVLSSDADSRLLHSNFERKQTAAVSLIACLLEIFQLSMDLRTDQTVLEP